MSAPGTRGRTALGVALILLGFAQINVGIRAVDAARSWLVPSLGTERTLWLATILWLTAMGGFVAAGFGLLGVSWLPAYSRLLVIGALAASGLVLILFAPFYTANIAALDAIVLGAVFIWAPRQAAVPRRAGRLAHVLAGGILAYLCLLALLRPWYTRWGTEGAEWQMPLVGDDVVSPPAFQVTRAIGVRTSADRVWPWLAQMGQDRAGFYSYDWLERLVGFDVRNADHIVPAWQYRAVGDLVPAAPPNFLGGVFGPDFGWHIAAFEPNRRVVLESPIMAWLFVLHPVNQSSTRLIIRLRGNASPRSGLFFITIIDFLAVQPIHFIMERKMLLTLKERSETSRGG
jgi:hypothetical protein